MVKMVKLSVRAAVSPVTVIAFTSKLTSANGTEQLLSHFHTRCAVVGICRQKGFAGRVKINFIVTQRKSLFILMSFRSALSILVPTIILFCDWILVPQFHCGTDSIISLFCQYKVDTPRFALESSFKLLSRFQKQVQYAVRHVKSK